jgi:hypothetical protein
LEGQSIDPTLASVGWLLHQNNHQSGIATESVPPALRKGQAEISRRLVSSQ